MDRLFRFKNGVPNCYKDCVLKYAPSRDCASCYVELKDHVFLSRKHNTY